tara:strand:+ start:851 stop:3145 length:2295 start_codon:yes stop_codon:yes gene_type:complete
MIFSTFWYFANDLPDYKVLSEYKPPVSSRVYSADGDLIAEYAIQKRLFISFDSIPGTVINSFLSAEDKNFFKHPGVDARGITRAIIKNVRNYMQSKRLEGASTITQQVAKNFLLSNEVSLKRKIKEAILAFRIERAYSKERIMELYLNQIYLGQGAYGVAAASLEYFDKAVKDLNYEEAALLAALPKAPSKYDPFKSKKLAKNRRNLVLKNILENNYISQEEYKKLIKKDIKLKKRKIKLFKEANFYSEEVRRIISEQYGYEQLYKEGLYIKTALKADHQLNALKALREGLESYDKRHGWRGPILNIKDKKNWFESVKQHSLEKNLGWKLAKVVNVEMLQANIEIENKKNEKIYFKDSSWTRKKNFREILSSGDIIYVQKNDKKKWILKQRPIVNGAIVVMDPFTGRVLSLVGGFSYELSEFNRATQAKRQPGSAFKPFVYAAALENGYSPSTLVLDAPFVIDQGEGKKNWKPQNYGKEFYGPSTLRKGIEKSRNLMTVRIAQDLGLKKISNISKNFNIYKDVPEVLSISLGSAETTLLNLTNAYCSFVNGGKQVKPILIDRIQDRRGNTIFKSDQRKCHGCENFSFSSDEIPKIKDEYPQIISEQTAYQITSMLEGAVKRGTGRKLKNLNIPLAGKTGTTNKNMDTWFVGYTSKLVIGVFVGFDEPKSLGRYETGAKTSLPIFKSFIKKSIKKEDAMPFKVPKGISFVMVDPNKGIVKELDYNKAIFESFKTSNLKNLYSGNFLNEKTKLYDNINPDKIYSFY